MNSQQSKFNLSVDSEVGELEGVILHTPGLEIENMTPKNAERALYSDILNLSVASKEYAQLKKVLEKLTKVFQISDLLKVVLHNSKVKHDLIERICENENAWEIQDELQQMTDEELSRCLIEGVLMKKDNLSRFLSHERYSLRPLHNFFFTRDSAVTINDWVLISRMANKVRTREAMISELILDYYPGFATKTVNSCLLDSCSKSSVKTEGGDILVARKDVLLIGIGARTTPDAVDFLIEHYKKLGQKQHIIVQELPKKPESFIHLDMVFTFLDVDTCMIYEPVILQHNKLRTVMITIDNGEVSRITEENNLLVALDKVGIPLNPILCGGSGDTWAQEREQWHSGANFFAIAPGKIIGYRRNVHTIEELDRKGFTVVDATDVAEGKVDLSKHDKAVITIDGSELARGGGGCRCMTMPLRRKPLDID